MTVNSNDIRVGVSPHDVRVVIPHDSPYFEFSEMGLFVEFTSNEARDLLAVITIGHEQSRRGGVYERNHKSAGPAKDWLVSIAPRYVPGVEKVEPFSITSTEIVGIDGMTITVKLPSARPRFRARPKTHSHNQGGGTRSPIYNPPKGAPRSAEKLQEPKPELPAIEALAGQTQARWTVSGEPSGAEVKVIEDSPMRPAIEAARELNAWVRDGSLRVKLDTEGCVVLFRLVEQEIK